MNKLAVYYHPVFLEHKTSRAHPESPERAKAIFDHLSRKDYASMIEMKMPEKIELDLVKEVHCPEMVTALRKACKEGVSRLDNDTLISRRSYEAALYAAGAVKDATDLAFASNKPSFCLVRPPGHHASASMPMGFCLLNNVAIGAQYALTEGKAKKVMILDFDAHHGNGTQEIFYERSDVLYVSWHQYPLFPGTGNFDEVGEDDGTGYNINIPLDTKTGDVAFLKTFTDFVKNIATIYKPDIFYISAGFDGHKDDPLSNLAYTAAGFKSFFKELKMLAEKLCNARVVIVLEGGYNIPALVHSVVNGLSAYQPGLVDEDVVIHKETPVYSNLERDTLLAEMLIDKIHNFQQHYWHV